MDESKSILFIVLTIIIYKYVFYIFSVTYGLI
jgi:hypothetical protein